MVNLISIVNKTIKMTPIKIEHFENCEVEYLKNPYKHSDFMYLFR